MSSQSRRNKKMFRVALKGLRDLGYNVDSGDLSGNETKDGALMVRVGDNFVGCVSQRFTGYKFIEMNSGFTRNRITPEQWNKHKDKQERMKLLRSKI